MPANLQGPSSSQRAQRNARDGPAPTNVPCQVVPAGDEPPCKRPANNSTSRPGKGEAVREDIGESLPLCKEHYSERRELYYLYKAASEKAERMKTTIERECKAPDAEHWGKEKLDEAIEAREAYDEALQDEVKQRGGFSKRFYTQGDEGHNKWIQGRQSLQVENNKALDNLRQRRDVLVEAEANARAEEDQRRAEAEVRQGHGPTGSETQPLLVNAGRSPPAAARTASMPPYCAVEQRPDALNPYSEVNESLCPGFFDICLALVLGVCAFFVFVRIVG